MYSAGIRFNTKTTPLRTERRIILNKIILFTVSVKNNASRHIYICICCQFVSWKLPLLSTYDKPRHSWRHSSLRVLLMATHSLSFKFASTDRVSWTVPYKLSIHYNKSRVRHGLSECWMYIFVIFIPQQLYRITQK